MIKKVVIAAAGEGTRMLHLTKNKCKQLIEVRNRPFLSYLLDNLFKAGFREMILVVGYKEELIAEFLKKYKPPLKSLKESQYKIEMVSQYDVLGPKKKIYGTACPLMCVKDKMKKSNFIYLNGDNLYSIKDLKLINKGGEYSYVAGIRHKNAHKYGVLVKDNGLLKKVVEKPKEYLGNLINTGLYKFTPEIFNKIEKIKKSSRGEYEITDAINLLAKNKKVKIQEIDLWLDFGNPADIIKLSLFLKSFKKFKELFWKKRNYEIMSYRSRDIISKTKQYIERGQTVVCPTDTVYGLLADATNDKAVERVFETKKRDRTKPFPIFVRDIEMAKKLAVIDKDQEAFLRAVWPGRITAVLERKKNCLASKLASGNKKTIGLRIPDFKLINNLLAEINKPLTGTSANISGKPTSIKIKDVLKQFEEEKLSPDLILEANGLPKALPSSIIDLTKNKPKVLR